MEIKVLHLGLIKTNCYLVSTQKAAVVIDPGFIREGTYDFLDQNSDKERLILLTHAHFDHIGGAADLREKTGVKIAIGEEDAPALCDKSLNLADCFHADIPPFSADITFKNGDEFSVGDIKFRVMHTPGHTVGGVCYYTEDCLFSGDTLFESSAGRTDFPGGDMKALKKSLRRLMLLPGDVKVYPGHGDFTTISRERENNMFVW